MVYLDVVVGRINRQHDVIVSNVSNVVCITEFLSR